MSKRVQVSPDAGTTWYTLPGSKGDKSLTMGSINDTIFGQDYQSNQPGLEGWNISAEGMYKGFAGYVAKVLQSGAPTTFTGEATTLVSGKTYKITNAAKNIWNRAVTPTVKDTGVTVSGANILSIDFLFGRVTFVGGYTVNGAITVDGSYLPSTQIAGAKSFTLTQQAATIDASTYDTTQANNGYRTYLYGLKTVKLQLKGIYSASYAFEALIAARSEIVIEVCPDGNELSVARGWFKSSEFSQSGNVGELEDTTLAFELFVPDQANVIAPYSWVHAPSTTLSLAVQTCLNAWTNNDNTNFYVNYLPNGTTGYKGKGIITDISLDSGLEAMNTFMVKVQGCDAPVAFP